MLYGIPPWQSKNEKVLIQLMREKTLNEEAFAGLKNGNLIDFMVKCCEPVERKRMKIE